MKSAAPLLSSGGELHIVGRHDVHTLADPDGAVQRLVELADGSRSTDELFCMLSVDYPRLGAQDVVDVVRELQSVGLFDDSTPRRRVLNGAGTGTGTRWSAATIYD